MPAKVSDIHEFSVIASIESKTDLSLIKDINKTFEVLKMHMDKYSGVSITLDDYKKNIELVERGFNLGTLIKKKLNVESASARWVANKDIKKDSSDILVNTMGVSLKDNSKIVRNCGFSEVLETYCENPFKKFKDPFWEFSPTLSANLMHIIINDCFVRGILFINEKGLFINNNLISSTVRDAKDISFMNINKIIELFTRKHVKTLVKTFATNGDTTKLLDIRNKLVNEVSHKVVTVLKEGLSSNPTYVGEKFKKLLQYSKEIKLFGYSSKRNIYYIGNIPTKDISKVYVKDVYTEKSKLNDRTIGLQINIYSDIEITIVGQPSQNIKFQNQLRYKHRTFTCAPEANLHLLSEKAWELIYPLLEPRL